MSWQRVSEVPFTVLGLEADSSDTSSAFVFGEIPPGIPRIGAFARWDEATGELWITAQNHGLPWTPRPCRPPPR